MLIAQIKSGHTNLGTRISICGAYFVLVFYIHFSSDSCGQILLES